MAGFVRNQWPESIGIGGRLQSESTAGITRNMHGLCKISNLFVIARNSSFAYKGKSLNVQQIGKELGVRYALEGSVQKSGERVRITCQLIDTITGYHLWSENYDRDLTDIFALQDEITLKLINTMQIKLVSGEEARLWAGSTKSIKAYDSYMRAMDFFERYNEKDNIQARNFCKQAINIDKKYAMAYALLGFTHYCDLGYGWSKAPIKSIEKAEKNAKKALELNDSLDITHCLLGMSCLFRRQYDDAIKSGQRAIELNPNGAQAHSLFGFILLCSDKTELSIKLLNRAILLSPIPPSYFYVFLAMAYRNIGEYEKAVELARKGLVGNPDQISPNLVLVASYYLLNRTKEAHKAVEEILRVDPSFSVGKFSDMITYKNQDTKDRYVEALRNAGLPE